MTTRSVQTASALALLAAVVATPLTAQAVRQGYGGTVARFGDAVLVAEANNLIGPAAIHAYRLSGGEWVEAGRIPQSDWQEEDRFGTAIVRAGDLLVVSAPGQDEARGAIYTYRLDGADFVELSRTPFPNEEPGAARGSTLAATDGLLIVGGPTGAPEVFAWRDGEWMSEGRLEAEGVGEDDAYGLSAAIAGDVAFVGAPRQAEGMGAVYTFSRSEDGAWAATGALEVRGLAENDGFGRTIEFNGTDEAWIGAPNRNGSGEVLQVTRDADTGAWSVAQRLAPFVPGGRDQFGVAIHATDEAVMVGGAFANGFRGAVYVFERGEDGTISSASLFGRDDTQRNTRFAQAVAVADDIAIVGSPGDDNGAGTAQVFVHDAGTWRYTTTLASAPESLDPVMGGEVACASGEASRWSCEQVDLLAFLPITSMGAGRGNRLNDVWGWTDPETGSEYALVGRIDGLSIVDLSDAASPVYLGDLPMTPGSNPAVWRDMKVYDDHVYVVADGAGQHGMQVLDLTQLRDLDRSALPVTFEPDLVYDDIASAHNVVINEESGFAYIVGARGGGETCGGGLHMVDIREPLNPTFVGCFQDQSTGRAGTGYSHDAQCVMYAGPDEEHVGKEICVGSNETALSIADVSDKSAPVALSRAEYPNFGYTHQAWLTEDHRYLYMNDELDELQGKVENTRTLIWDVSDLDDPQLVKEHFASTRAIDHNLYVRGNFVYESNNTAGLRILDISDPENPQEVGYFDTIPYGGDRPAFGGSWSAYPYFESGTIVVTGGPLGLFLLRKQEPVS